MCADPGSVYEGSPDVAFDCAASGALGSSPVYSYAWAPRGSTTDVSLLSDAGSPTPTFAVPSSVTANETYEYTLTASADNAEDASADVTVTVLNKPALSVVCADPGSVYEGSPDLALDCVASGALGSSPVYSYVWTASGSTTDVSLLSDTSSPTPAFAVPANVNANETYEYTLTASADNAEDASADITVIGARQGRACGGVRFTSSDLRGFSRLRSELHGVGRSGSTSPVYSYAWTASGDDDGYCRCSAIRAARLRRSPFLRMWPPTRRTSTRLRRARTMRTDASTDITVTVLEQACTLSVACADPGSVYEGAADFALDCTWRRALRAPGSVYSNMYGRRAARRLTCRCSAVRAARLRRSPFLPR